LHITQSTLSRQITEIEEKYRFRLFTRDNRRAVRVGLTDAGRVFVDGACCSLLNMERAVQLARTAQDGGDNGEPISSIAVARDYLRRRFVLLSQNLTQQE
jgi:DNA-binding transcriptional LysR family regulator